MSEKRFTFSTKWRWILFDNETEKFMDMEDCKDKLNEQQATICKLQDLCGQSDGENAKLRIENKRLQEENEQLKADEKLYAQEILRLKKELKENQALKLGNDY